ncbi:MAG: pyridoxal 5'-phosphate synthase lyase subunit PdxS, partial [Bacilli bacterium]
MNFRDYDLLAKLSQGIGTPMKGIEMSTLSINERMAERGW